MGWRASWPREPCSTPTVSSPLTLTKMVLVLAVAWNGAARSALRRRMAQLPAYVKPADLPRRDWRLMMTATVISQVGWWGAILIGFVQLVDMTTPAHRTAGLSPAATPVVAVVAGLLACAVAAWSTGAMEPLVFVEDSGPLVRWAVPLVRVGHDVAAAVTLGALVFAASIIPGSPARPAAASAAPVSRAERRPGDPARCRAATGTGAAAGDARRPRLDRRCARRRGADLRRRGGPAADEQRPGSAARRPRLADRRDPHRA